MVTTTGDGGKWVIFSELFFERHPTLMMDVLHYSRETTSSTKLVRSKPAAVPGLRDYWMKARSVLAGEVVSFQLGLVLGFLLRSSPRRLHSRVLCSRVMLKITVC